MYRNPDPLARFHNLLAGSKRCECCVVCNIIYLYLSLYYCILNICTYMFCFFLFFFAFFYIYIFALYSLRYLSFIHRVKCVKTIQED